MSLNGESAWGLCRLARCHVGYGNDLGDGTTADGPHPWRLSEHLGFLLLIQF